MNLHPSTIQLHAPWGESTSNIIIPGDPLLTSQSTPPFTITLWYNIQTHQTGTQYWDNMVSIQGYTGLEFVDQGSGEASVFLHRCYTDVAGITEPYNMFFNGAWHFIAVSFNSSNGKYFFQFDGSNNTVINSGSFGFNQGSTVIGGPAGCVYDEPFAGELSNIQIYNTSLSANEISALYLEGIGGAPIDPTHIVGWWPLNGNAQDYSGNNNGGVPTSISYTASWASGYTQP